MYLSLEIFGLHPRLSGGNSSSLTCRGISAPSANLMRRSALAHLGTLPEMHRISCVVNASVLDAGGTTHQPISVLTSIIAETCSISRS